LELVPPTETVKVALAPEDVLLGGGGFTIAVAEEAGWLAYSLLLPLPAVLVHGCGDTPEVLGRK
jgi:hypothetical protein